MPTPLTSLYADQLDFARQETLKASAKVPQEKRFFQIREGKATPLWLMGHLANTINTIILRWTLDQESLLSKETSLLFAPDFAGAPPPSSDPELYPSWEEVIALYDRAMQQAVEGIRAMDDADLPNPVRRNLPEPIITLFPNRGAALTRLIGHDAYHRGQMGLLANL